MNNDANNARDTKAPIRFPVVVREEPPGQFTAEAVGLPELRATALTRDDAIDQVRTLLYRWRFNGQMVLVEVPAENPLLKWRGWAKDDPLEEEYLAELGRLKQEDYERTLRELDEECPGSSSTPTT